MKQWKKYVVINTAFILPFLISGCDDSNLTKIEDTLVGQCTAQLRSTQSNQNIWCSNEYSGTLSDIKDSRLKNPDIMPFKLQGFVFKMEDTAFKKKYPNAMSINDIWHETSGEWIYTPSYAKNTTDVKTVDNKTILSPQLYDELINAVKTCNRAAISSVQFQMGSTLSPEEYDKVMNIILECKKFQLEQAINQK